MTHQKAICPRCRRERALRKDGRHFSRHVCIPRTGDLVNKLERGIALATMSQQSDVAAKMTRTLEMAVNHSLPKPTEQRRRYDRPAV